MCHGHHHCQLRSPLPIKSQCADHVQLQHWQDWPGSKATISPKTLTTEPSKQARGDCCEKLSTFEIEMKSDILRRQNFSSTTFNGTLHLATSTAVVQQSYLQPILSLFPSSHVHNFLPILQSVHFCRSIQSLFNENVPSLNLSIECVFENSFEWVAVVRCWEVAIATQSPPSGHFNSKWTGPSIC